MKKSIFALLVAAAMVWGLALPTPASAQTSIGSVRPLTTNATLSATNAGTCITTGTGCVVLNTGGYVGLSVQVTANASGNTLQFEFTLDPAPTSSSVWSSMTVSPMVSGTGVTSTTSTGAWSVNVLAQAVRVRMSTLAGGTTTVYLRSSLSASRGNSVGAFSGTLTLNDGTAAAPSLVFSSDPTTGWYRNAADTW